MTITLYAAPHSLYAGKARSYLIKAGIAYREQVPNTRHYLTSVLPQAGGRQSMPTVELQDGQVIRDGAAIIDHFEAAGGQAFTPTMPTQRIVSLLFDVIGTEGLLRPAMHYRWNFDDENAEFLTAHFRMLPPAGMEDRAEKMMDAMRQATGFFGVVPESIPVVEALYEALLPKLDTHFKAHPYLLGGKPCIGDFGMIAPLFAHLGRDPKPLSLMQRYPGLLRWVERMNRLDADMGEFTDRDESYLADDSIPETLLDVLVHLATDFVPETQAAAGTINAWLSEQKDLPPNSEVARGVGLASFEVRGVVINALAQPYRFYLLKRVQDAIAALDSHAHKSVMALLERCNMCELLDISLNREIGRYHNLEVWG